MSLHYQVKTEFSLTHGKPSLKSITINSTQSAVTDILAYPVYNVLKNYRIFHSLKEAKNYILYLNRIYQNIKSQQPVLDCGQKFLF